MAENEAHDDAGADDTPDDTPPFWRLPQYMRDLVEGVGFVEIEVEDEDEAQVYNLMRNGRCMTCKNELGDNSNFILTRYGIAAGYCSGQCHSDMAVMGWIQESFDDIQSAIKFRGDFPADEGEDNVEEQEPQD